MGIDDFIGVIKAIDGGIAVAVMLYIGRELRTAQREQWTDLMRLIDKLTNGHESTTRDE